MDYKNKLGVVYGIAAIGIMYAAIVYAGAYARSIQPSSFRSFSVSGEGKVVAIPDVAQFSFSVVTEGGKDLSAIDGDNTNKYNKVIDFLKAQGVKKEDIETTESSILPRSQTYSCTQSFYPQGGIRPCPPSEVVGYTVRKSVSVKVRDFKKAGEILSGAVTAGANEVSGLNFAIDDRTKIESEAREKAIAQAKEKARAVAKAGGFRLGRLLSIEESGGGVPYYAKDATFEAVSFAPSRAPVASIEPGSDKVTINVFLRYEID